MSAHVRCPKCFKDKPWGAEVCPNCMQRVTGKEVAVAEIWGIIWFVVIIYIIYKLMGN